MEEKKPTIPEEYAVPEIWSPPGDMGGTFGGMNRPTAGARFEEDLARGNASLQLYTLPTPNGQKVGIMLEELGVPYDAHRIPLAGKKAMQFSSGFVQVNPNSKIPAMWDYGFNPPVRVFESGNVLLYLAEKHQKFIPDNLAARTECLNWLFWQMSSAPYIGGGFGHFYRYAPTHFKYCIDRYTMEVKRQLDVLDHHLEGKDYMCGSDVTIADFAIYPWVAVHRTGYHTEKFIQLHSYKSVASWMRRMSSRPGVTRGMMVGAKPAPKL